MDRDAIRAFARRDRSEVEQAKLDRWAALYREGGAGAMIELGWALAEHARTVQPDWPSRSSRADDLADHTRLSLLLERARDAFAHR